MPTATTTWPTSPAKCSSKLRGCQAVEVEYIAFVEAGTVRLVSKVTGPTVVAIAARVGKTRLIDNCLIG